MTFAYVLARAAAGTNQVSMLDWGGGAGQYYILASDLLPDLKLDYVCKETFTLCSLGRELLPEARFEEDETLALDRQYDLVVASSSAHYSEDWRILLSGLCRSSGRYLFVTRTPVVEIVPSFVVLQRPYRYGYSTEYLCWFINRQELVSHVESEGMVLVREFLVDEQPVVPGAPEQCRYRGFLFGRP
jgi:putative methyltransferase (TIGR04325 family)